MNRLKQDLRVAVRRLRSSLGFTIAAIVTLALGIGANTTIFTAVNTVVFRSLPVNHPEQLFSVNTKTYKTEFPVQSFPNYRDTRNRSTDVAAGLASYRIDAINFSRGGDLVGKHGRVRRFVVLGFSSKLRG